MSEDRFIELAPIAALGALDGEDRGAFEAHAASCAACRAELSAHEAVAARLPLALSAKPPSPDLRRRVLETALPGAAPAEGAAAPALTPSRSWLFPVLATAAAVAMGVGVLITRAQRDAARQDAVLARQEAVSARSEAERAQVELSTLRRTLAEERAFRELVGHPESHVTVLAGLGPAASARGRVIWNPGSREAVLVASGLPPAPEGKAYEVWVIAGAAPVPAGLFQVDAEGKAVFRLPVVEETARVKTFAVTLEPAAGVPAPTGPMVLAGAVS